MMLSGPSALPRSGLAHHSGIMTAHLTPDIPSKPSADLHEIDDIMSRLHEEDRDEATKEADRQHDDATFSDDFTTMCTTVRPAMDAIVARMERNGGGGLVVERPTDHQQRRSHRLTLWMSVHGDITGAPRQDRNPYLQLDADVEQREVIVSEGDLWSGRTEGHSGRITTWKLPTVTADLVTTETLAILHRALP
jgi:hypothetical protein